MDSSNKFSLNGKNVLITGGAGILGETFSYGLAQAGARIAVLDLDPVKVKAVTDKINSQFKDQALAISCDITNPKAVKESVNKVVKEFGTIDVLHNNAATKGGDLNRFFDPFEEYSLDTWQEIMRVNVDGMFLMAQAVGKHMVDNQIKGSIIQTASIYGVVAPDQRIYEGSNYLGGPINTPAVYSASKGAVVALTKYLATYWGAKGIRVNTLTPGGVESGQNDIFRNNYSAKVPLGRMASKEEILNALIFLASDASSYMTGQNIVVDGGFTAW